MIEFIGGLLFGFSFTLIFFLIHIYGIRRDHSKLVRELRGEIARHETLIRLNASNKPKRINRGIIQWVRCTT